MSVPEVSPRGERPVVIGLYGVSGCGKSFLMNQLREHLGTTSFTYYDGSGMIADVCPGGLEAFKKMSVSDKYRWREVAITAIMTESLQSGKAAIVTGHGLFQMDSEDLETGHGSVCCTEADGKTYTHIVYLNIPSEAVAHQTRDDKTKLRPVLSEDEIRKWQYAEKEALRQFCRDHGILFAVLSKHPQSIFSQAVQLLNDFVGHSESNNLFRARRLLDEVVLDNGCLKTMLLLDGDKTLAERDTGKLFWENACNAYCSGDTQDTRKSSGGSDIHRPSEWDAPLRTLFSSRLGYTYKAFRQATLLYEEVADKYDFDSLCRQVASDVVIHPEFLSILHETRNHQHVGAVVVTSGLKSVWEKVLSNAGLSTVVKVIGGGRISDGFVVSADVKEALAKHLKKKHDIHVWAFGDSPLDLGMLRSADQAIVVAGEASTRSKSMDAALMSAIVNRGLRVRQVLLPSNVPVRLNTNLVPLIQLDDPAFAKDLFCRPRQRSRIVFRHVTETNAARLLTSGTRDATLAGPSLREAHRRIGWYLATTFVAESIGLEEYQIPHVQGHSTVGHRLAYESQTIIVALMRGGEPMAFGVNDAFPLAAFLHAKHAQDITVGNLQGKRTLILVDSVVNSGGTVVDFIHHVDSLGTDVHIVVVAGVVQAQCVRPGGSLDMLTGNGAVELVALRISENKFTGSGTTDTGNRLFNTTSLT